MTNHATELEVMALSDHEWRVCDGEVDRRDARRLLAYIQRLDADYEVMWITAPYTCASFATLEAALTRVGLIRHQNALLPSTQGSARHD